MAKHETKMYFKFTSGSAGNKYSNLIRAQNVFASYYYYYYYYYYVSCHRPILPGNSLEPTVILTAQASSFTLQYFPYYV
jgi:hypothetical protein